MVLGGHRAEALKPRRVGQPAASPGSEGTRPYASVPMRAQKEIYRLWWAARLSPAEFGGLFNRFLDQRHVFELAVHILESEVEIFNAI